MAPEFPEAVRRKLLGVLLLDTRFPRPYGDIGHPDSFGVPVIHHVVAQAWPGKVVTTAASLRSSGLVPLFEDAARALQRAGAHAITTSCGFLVLLQQELQVAVNVPVVTSSLLQLPRLLAREPQVGVLAISARYLGTEHLLAAGVAQQRLADVLIQQVDPAGAFARAILGNEISLDLARAETEVVQAALALKSRAPHLRSVVLECTNMPPYAQAVREATGFELFSLLHPKWYAALGAPVASESLRDGR